MKTIDIFTRKEKEKNMNEQISSLTDEQYNAIEAILAQTIESDTVRGEIMTELEEAVRAWHDKNTD